jgi:two-component system KDP operon response regulator KdpE
VARRTPKAGSSSGRSLRRDVRVGATAVHLTPREYELLKALLANRGRVVTKARLLRAVWGGAYVEETAYLHVYVNRLRRKLAAADPSGATRDLITAEPGIGYRVADPDEPVDPAPPSGDRGGG